MPVAAFGDVLRFLHKVCGAEEAYDVTDGELLERFLSQREESAFAFLVRRHGPMILAVGRRVLGDCHEAEDVFQATFLVLARRTSAIRGKGSVGGWLHGVAQRIAARVRARGTARRRWQREAATMVDARPIDEAIWRELRSVLDEEIGSLPEKYRSAIVLCYLEGKSYEQAAREIGCPKSSLASRLARARDLLRRRLDRRGIALLAAGLTTALAQTAAAAPVPVLLSAKTVKAMALAAAGKSVASGCLSAQVTLLADEALKGMLAIKGKLVLLALTLGLVLSGSLAGYSALAEKEQPVATAEPQPPAIKDDKTAAAKNTPGTDLYGDPLPEPGLRTVLAKRASGCKQDAAETALVTTRRLKVMTTDCFQQLTLWDLGPQQVTVTFQGGRIVSDAGLLGIRKLEKELNVLAELAERLPDPRTQKFVVHPRVSLVSQQVYQILAGYPDCNDAQGLRHDPLFQTLLDLPPEEDQRPLASGSTLARFAQAYTRRQADLPLEERPVLSEVAAAQNRRLQILNDYLPELFVRTRRRRPPYVILDIDASDDPTHGQQVLSFFHGYFDQYQYFPLYVFDSATGFPLAAWLRPGTVHASCGAVEVLRSIVDKLRQSWPGITILVRGDSGFAMPAVYEYCEAEGLLYAFGYSGNSVLKERTEPIVADLEEYYRFYGRREPHVQRFERFEDYQADSWPAPRRIVAKVEINRHGVNRRFVVTNLSGHPQGIYQGFYVQRGAVPEQPIGELKNGLLADRLSFHHFRANAWKLLEHVMAYALAILHREATAGIPEVAKAQVSCLRAKLWKVGAIVKTSVRRIWFHFSESWPHRDLWQRVYQAIVQFVEQVRQQRHGFLTVPASAHTLLM